MNLTKAMTQYGSAGKFSIDARVNRNVKAIRQAKAVRKAAVKAVIAALQAELKAEAARDAKVVTSVRKAAQKAKEKARAQREKLHAKAKKGVRRPKAVVPPERTRGSAANPVPPVQ